MPATADWLPAAEPNRVLAENLRFQEMFDEELASGFEDRLRDTLHEIGIPPRLRQAIEGPIPKEITSLKCFRIFPERNFGLVGPGGCGKSCALAWSIKKTLLREFEEAGPIRIDDSPVEKARSILKHTPFEGPRQINPTTKTEFMWVGWPAYALKMKQLASKRDWDDPRASVHALTSWATLFPKRRVLVLDDIGEEQIKEDSYTSEQLEFLVDELYNYECRMMWTSNHTPDQMEAPTYYGYRLVTRLTGLAPDATLPHDLPDLRVRLRG